MNSAFNTQKLLKVSMGLVAFLALTVSFQNCEENNTSSSKDSSKVSVMDSQEAASTSQVLRDASSGGSTAAPPPIQKALVTKTVKLFKTLKSDSDGNIATTISTTEMLVQGYLLKVNFGKPPYSCYGPNAHLGQVCLRTEDPTIFYMAFSMFGGSRAALIEDKDGVKHFVPYTDGQGPDTVAMPYVPLTEVTGYAGVTAAIGDTPMNQDYYAQRLTDRPLDAATGKASKTYTSYWPGELPGKFICAQAEGCLGMASLSNEIKLSSNADFVKAAYKNYLKRDADTGGATWWETTLGSQDTAGHLKNRQRLIDEFIYLCKERKHNECPQQQYSTANALITNFDFSQTQLIKLGLGFLGTEL